MSFGLCGLPQVTRADESIRYQRDIQPILSNNCFKCHGPDLKKRGLDLQSFESATKKLDSGATAVVPGKSEQSELFRRVTAIGDGSKPAPFP